MPDLSEQHNELFEKAMQEFQKAFNAGYELNKHEPKLLESIIKTSGKDSQFIDGMRAGKKQHEKDKFIDQMKQTQEHSKDIQREK